MAVPKSRSKRSSRSSGTTRKSSGSASAGTRGSGKRDIVKAPNATFFAKRGPKGEFREMDEVGRSLTVDRRKRAKTEAPPGYGDRGDRRPRSPRSQT